MRSSIISNRNLELYINLHQSMKRLQCVIQLSEGRTAINIWRLFQICHTRSMWHIWMAYIIKGDLKLLQHKKPLLNGWQPAKCIMEVVATVTGIRRMVESCRAVEHQVTLWLTVRSLHSILQITSKSMWDIWRLNKKKIKKNNSNQAHRRSFRLAVTSERMQTYIDRFLNGLHTRVKMDLLTWMYRGFLKNPHGNRPLAIANAEHLTAAAEAINSVCTSHSYQATPVGVTLENFHI